MGDIRDGGGLYRLILLRFGTVYEVPSPTPYFIKSQLLCVIIENYN